MYAGRRRRKPVPRTAKLPPSEGVKANPSKRHRERLNSELECLASLLPFPNEVISSLDKLSILRLTVSYLRTQSFFQGKLWALLHSRSCSRGVEGARGQSPTRKTWGILEGIVPEGELLLQALNGFVLVVTSEGLIFYSSHTIQDYLGFHQTDVLHQSVFELIHTEDQPEFRRNLCWRLPSTPKAESDQACSGETSSSPSDSSDRLEELPPENSAVLERNFVCRFRCLLDNSSGFRALSLQGRLKPLHGQNHRTKNGSPAPPQLALFAVSTPLQPPSILEIRTKTLTFRTKHKLDFTPVACDAKGKLVLGYTEAELRMRGTGYQFIHAADMLYCAENHIRMMRTGESGLTVFRLLTKENRWRWVQSNARLVYRNGKPDYIIATQRPLVDEEGGEHLQKRSLHHPFTFATGEALLYHATHPDPGFPDPFQTKGKVPKFRKSPKGERSQLDLPAPNSLRGAMMQQDAAIYVSHAAVTPELSFSTDILGQIGEPFVAQVTGDILAGTSRVISSEHQHKELVDLNQGAALLATLDSLSLDCDETCSNNELLGALENLGLNAEELELLLLDEWRVRGGEKPGPSPSLNEMLTNREILSHVHGSLLNKNENEQVGDPLASLRTHSLSSPSQEPEVNNSHMAHQYPLHIPQEPQPNQLAQILCLPNTMQHRGVSQKQPSHLPWKPGPSQPETYERPNQNSREPWRHLSVTSQHLSALFTQSPTEIEQQCTQWPPSNSSGLLSPSFLHQSLENPYQPKQSQQQLEKHLGSQHGGHQPIFQHQLHVQPQQLRGHTSSESGSLLQPHTDLNLVMNRSQSCDSPSQQILGDNLWPNHVSRNQDPTQTKLLSQAGNSTGPQVYSRNVQRESRKSQTRINQNRLDSVDTGKSHGTGAEMVPGQRSLLPCTCHPIPLKPSASISSETMFPFQNFTSDHFVNGEGCQETLSENMCELANRSLESWEDFLLPSGQPTATTERHSCPKVFPQSSPSSNGGFYF
ncbi:aryl hydrocarbon receptor-like [Dromiciops gliroides]|uniref:aryl hydrocarbon receptor-like n=1 Tax=Dromiciops gliroides TaxID=33562 RepID=UPI001CC4C710|nr:aryl hydrocarbon receptor-like [Dromiciops gliroides]